MTNALSMNILVAAILSIILLSGFLADALPVPRSPDTCADPSLAEVFKEGYSPSLKAHAVSLLTAFVASNVEGDDWQIQNDAFMAWGQQQEFTFPLYVLFNPATEDYIYIVSNDGTVPTAAGFESPLIVGYVYDSQVCGSVPLFSLFQDEFGDHWYTTQTAERDELVADGWIDSGVTAFVLPLAS